MGRVNPNHRPADHESAAATDWPSPPADERASARAGRECSRARTGSRSLL